MRLGHASPERRDTRGCGTRPTYEWWGGWVRATAPAGEGGASPRPMAHQANVPATELHRQLLAARHWLRTASARGNERGWDLCQKLTSASEPVAGRKLQTSRGTKASHPSGPVSRSVCVCVPAAWQTCARPLRIFWHATSWRHIQLVTMSVAGRRCSGGRGAPMPEAGWVPQPAHRGAAARLPLPRGNRKPPVGFEPTTSCLLSGCSAS